MWVLRHGSGACSVPPTTVRKQPGGTVNSTTLGSVRRWVAARASRSAAIERATVRRRQKAVISSSTLASSN